MSATDTSGITSATFTNRNPRVSPDGDTDAIQASPPPLAEDGDFFLSTGYGEQAVRVARQVNGREVVTGLPANLATNSTAANRGGK